jgi:hypothetical protein
VVEKTKAHGFAVAGMVPWGSNGTKGIFQITRDDGVGGFKGRPG